MRHQLRLTALSLLTLGLAVGCAADPTYEIDMGDRSDDLGGREFSIVANDGQRIQAGSHTAQIVLLEREDTSVTIYPDSFIVNPDSFEFEVKQPSSWVSFNTTLYGFMFGYRPLGSDDEWTPVSDNSSLSSYTIFQDAEFRLVNGDYQISGTGISFDDVEFDENSTSPSRFNEFAALATGLPRRFELRIIPIPVFNYGDFEDSYEVDFEVTVL